MSEVVYRPFPEYVVQVVEFEHRRADGTVVDTVWEFYSAWPTLGGARLEADILAKNTERVRVIKREAPQS